MKKNLKKTILMYLVAKGGLVCSLAIMLTVVGCSYRASNALMESDLLEFANKEVIEVGYTENVLGKLADSNTKKETKEVKEEESVEVVPSVEVVEEAPVVEQQPVVEEVIVEEPVLVTVQSNVELGTQIANFATQHVGNPYAYGGTSLTSGADCSGFVMAVYSSFGISLPRTATDQSYSGAQVSLDYLQPGDLIFYGYGAISHAAIYIGNGQIVHAMNEAMGINISSYNFMPIIKAVRII